MTSGLHEQHFCTLRNIALIAFAENGPYNGTCGFSPRQKCKTNHPSVVLVLHQLSSTVTQLASIYGPTTAENSTKRHFHEVVPEGWHRAVIPLSLLQNVPENSVMAGKREAE